MKPKFIPFYEETTEFEIIAIGVCSASVCTSLSIADATNMLNMTHPTGIQSRWAKSKDKTFRTGESNPCKCEKHPKTHRHILFNC